jgi:hypothetical protein
MNKRRRQNLSVLSKQQPLVYAQLMSLFETPMTEPPPSCVDSSTHRQTITTALDQGMDFLYLLGVGDGTLLFHAVETVTQGNRGILVIEARVHRFFQILDHVDLRGVFQNKRVFWAVGEGIQEQIAAQFDQTLCFAASQPHFIGEETTPPYEIIIAFCQQEIARRKKEITDLVKQLPNLLQSRQNLQKTIWTYADLRGKAGYSLIQHVLIRTLLHALRQCGYNTEYTVMKPERYYPPYYRIFRMAQAQPDILFLCNEAPATEISIGTELSRALPIPKIIWFADDPLYGEHLLERNKLTDGEICLIADYEWADTLKKHGATDIQFMPGAATRTRRGKKRASRTCEIVFVGQVRDNRAFFAKLTPPWRRYCQQVINEKMHFPRKKVRDVMAQFPMPHALPSDHLDDFRQRLLWEANTQFRLHMIRALQDYDLHVYGNPDWLRLLPDDRFAACFKGVLPFKHLFEVYRNAKIVLNIHSLQSYTCMNVRDFDVPAAGGFLLSDWLPKSDEVYIPGFVANLPLTETSTEEVFFYRSIAELQQLIAYFLEHPEKRAQCMERARTAVMQRHRYQNRAEFIDRVIRQISTHPRD